MESTRTTAMKWWNPLSPAEKQRYASRYYDRPWQSLTGREIEKIWKSLK